MTADDAGGFLASLTDTSLYSIGAFFADRSPDLVADVIEQAAEIEAAGLERYAAEEGITLESAFKTLVTGLACRYYRAVSGGPGDGRR